MELLATTDHFSPMLFARPEDPRNYQYLSTQYEIPEEWMGVRLLKGCEADIVDMEGHLFGYDIPIERIITGDPLPERERGSLLERTTRKLDYIIASVHGREFAKNAGRAACTELYLRALEQPKVFILGHIGRSGLPVELDPILLLAKEKHKLVEINEHSLGGGEAVESRCREIAIRCAELDVPISVSTDAHISCDIGRFEHVPSMLREIHFPEELIASRDKESFLAMLERSGVGQDESCVRRTAAVS